MKRYKDTEYFVSKDGEVYRYNRKRKLIKDKDGYLQVNLWVNGKGYGKKVHRLVAETFIPNPEKKLQVNHINGIKTDNRIENLEWVTASENQLHRTHILKKGIGENSSSKLTQEQVDWIRDKYLVYLFFCPTIMFLILKNIIQLVYQKSLM